MQYHWMRGLLARVLIVCVLVASLLTSLSVSCSSVCGAITDPRDLAGNVLWLDGSDVDGDFVTGGTFVGGTTWVDKSIVGTADAIQSTASQQPTVVEDVLNGMTVVRLDGVDDVMDIDSQAFGMLSNVAGATLFGVVSTDQAPSTRGQRVLMISTGTSSASSRAGLNFFDTFGTSVVGSGDFGLAGRRLDSDAYQRITGGSLEANQFNQFAGVFEYSAGELSLYQNGLLETFASNFQTAGNTSATDSVNIRIGADASTDHLRGLFDGDIAELIVYDRALNDTERQSVEAYLHLKWFSASGISADYDSDDDVDGDDLATWQAAYGSGSGADTNADGDSDGQDYLAWLAQFTGDLSSDLDAVVTVPEPASWQLAMFAGITAFMACDHRQLDARCHENS